MYDLETTAYKVKRTTNCASQTAVMMWGIVCVYMLKLIDVFFFKRKKKKIVRCMTSRPPLVKLSALSTVLARLRWWCKKNIRVHMI